MLFALRVLMRTAHVLAGGVWVGGSLVYLLVIVPALRVTRAEPRVGQAVGEHFRVVVSVCIGVLLLSGVYLIADRFTTATVGVVYVGVLAVKIAAALMMFWLALLQAQEARRRAKHRSRLWAIAPRLILGLGILTFVLGALLTSLFEATLARGQ